MLPNVTGLCRTFTDPAGRSRDVSKTSLPDGHRNRRRVLLKLLSGRKQKILGGGLIQRAAEDGGVCVAVAVHLVGFVQVQLTG